MYPEPSAPPLIDLLNKEDDTANVDYNCEEGCDVEFLVGKSDEELIRIPVHSHKLAEYSVFKAMLSQDYDAKYDTCVCSGHHDGGQRKLRQIRVNWIDRKAFDNVMRFVYKKPINLQAPEMTVETLKAAHEFLLLGLVRTCVKHLSKMISQSNVLFIFANVRYLCNDLENLEELIQSGKQMPLPKRRKQSLFISPQTNQTANQNAIDSQPQDNHLSAGLEMKNLCAWLLCECLAFIDVHAKSVLESDELEELDQTYVKLLLQRDSLDASEQAIFSAIVRWAETECKRQHLPLTSESKRLVLHDLIYVVRFFQMSTFEFLAGPGESGLLSQDEIKFIKSVLLDVNGQPHFSTMTPSSSSGQTKENLLCSPVTLNKHLVQNQESLLPLKFHWKYLSRPRNPRLNNGYFGTSGEGKGQDGETENGKKRRKYSLEGTPKKGLLKFKRIKILLKSYFIPCTNQSMKPKWDANGFPFVLISNDLNHVKEDISSQQNSENETKGSPRTLTRRQSSFSKAFDYSLRAFAFFFD